MDKLKLSEKFESEIFKGALKKAFENKNGLNLGDECEIYHDPFSCVYLKNFINTSSNEELATISKDLGKLNMRSKNNDLYKFSQSVDFKKLKNRNLPTVRNFFLNSVLPWMKESTGIPLKDDSIDITCSSYGDTDILLCHDDELEGRRVAFVWYLVPEDWSVEDGGALDIIKADDNLQPTFIVRSLVPERNSFVFFEVGPRSFHQVAEVLNPNKTRLSINGWFHGPALPRPPRYVDPGPPLMLPADIEESLVYKWINPAYLDMATQDEIQEGFVDTSEVQLPDFIVSEQYSLLEKALVCKEIDWKIVGPLNARRLHCAQDSDNPLPEPLRELARLFTSEAMMVILSDLTALSLHSSARSSAPEDDVTVQSALDEEKAEKEGPPADKKAKLTSDVAENTTSESQSQERKCGRYKFGEWRRCVHNCYTLLRDGDSWSSGNGLEVLFHVGCRDTWRKEHGGYRSYIVKGEDEELLTVCPMNNALSLVCVDSDTLSFMKHINNKFNKTSPQTCDASSQSAFFELFSVYYEYR